MTVYRVTNARTGRYVRFMCISDVLGYLRLRGRTIYNVRDFEDVRKVVKKLCRG